MSNSSLVVRASQVLGSSPLYALRKLRVEGNEQALIISGQVSCYYHKQLAQETLMPLRGQLQLLNHVNVEA